MVSSILAIALDDQVQVDLAPVVSREVVEANGQAVRHELVRREGGDDGAAVGVSEENGLASNIQTASEASQHFTNSWGMDLPSGSDDPFVIMITDGVELDMIIGFQVSPSEILSFQLGMLKVLLQQLALGSLKGRKNY